ncbi:MAG TPA: zinc-binding dehydrogenase, partial [Chondromyces sp.]|nr:zinc-binding dehydrogenase [Chondromyces sp.]
IVIDCIGKATFSKSLKQLKKGGKIVSFGGTSGYDLQINLFEIFMNQQTLLGTTMGSRDEFIEMLSFIEKYQIKPVIDEIFHISDTDKALKKMDEAEQFGKLAIKICE